jgi:Flp pilus assembly protein TadD
MVRNHATEAEYVQTPNPMEMHGDVVKISVAGSYRANYFHRNAGILFQPELRYDGGSLLLRPMTLRGENAANDLEGTTIPRTGGRFTYTYEIPFKPEFVDGAQLVVNPTVFLARRARGGNTPTSNEAALAFAGAQALSQKTMATGINVTPLLADNTSAAPAHARDNYRAPDNEFVRANLHFVKDMTNLNMNLASNRTDAATEAFAALSAALAGDLEIAGISIEAWASPEGELSRNDALARGRSATAERFLRDAYRRVIDEAVRQHNANLPRGERRITARDLMQELPLTVEAKGEDWDGFMSALRASNVRDRDRILNVIAMNTERSAREQEMRNMVVIYPELDEVILPPLRRAEMVIELIIPAKTNEEMAELSMSNPSELTVEELLFAATLMSDDAGRLKVYTAASQVYPEEWRSWNNKGYLEIKAGNLAAAKTALTKANELSANNGAVLNNLGILALAEENFEEARTYFENARSRGNTEAAGNLAPILIRDGDYTTAASVVASRQGDLNLALAQILSGNLPGAKQTLAAAPASPLASYLKAIVAAREDNANEVFSNLRATSAELKRKAQTDAEFQKFANQVEFVNAVR